MNRSLAVAIAALFALVSIRAAAEEPADSNAPSTSEGAKKGHARPGVKKGGSKAAAKKSGRKAAPKKDGAAAPAADKYAPTLEKMRDLAFSLEGLRHLEQRPTDFLSQSELVGGVQGEKQKVRNTIARARKFAATAKFKHLVHFDDEAKRFAEKLKNYESLAVSNGWIAQ